MKTLFAILLTLIVALAGAARAAPSVTVERDAAGFTATYDLDADAPVWAFARSALVMDSRTPWRPERWRIVTPGVRLERIGDYDVLTTETGAPVPRRVEIAVQPARDVLEADYTPALVFTDGSVALFSGHFDVFPLADAAAARALPADLNGAGVEVDSPAITWRDAAGPVLIEGRREAMARSDRPDLYVLFGEARTVETEALATVIDPALPAWIGAEIAATAPRIADIYSGTLGPGQTARPTVMAAWNGAETPGFSMNGSVLPGLIVMSFSGQGVSEPSDEVGDYVRWFIAHEAAHFWLGQVVAYAQAKDAWIMEGGADLMAIRALERIDPDYDGKAAIQSAVDDCVRLTEGGKAIETAASRGEHRALYACGTVFWLAAERALNFRRRSDVLDAVAPFIAEHRAAGTVTRADFFAHLSRLADDPTSGAVMEALLDGRADSSARSIESILNGVGVRAHIEDGRVLLD